MGGVDSTCTAPHLVELPHRRPQRRVLRLLRGLRVGACVGDSLRGAGRRAGLGSGGARRDGLLARARRRSLGFVQGELRRRLRGRRRRRFAPRGLERARELVDVRRVAAALIRQRARRRTRRRGSRVPLLLRRRRSLLQLGLALPGVRIVTWTVVGVNFNRCFDCKIM
jgi:hypothetical protein